MRILTPFREHHFAEYLLVEHLSMAASIKLKLNFLPLSFNSFSTLTQNFKSIPHVSPKLLNFNQEHPVKSLQN